MSVNKTGINNFLLLSAQFPMIDVRSPAEFEHAHIPGAYNLPLFDNEERKVVGTAYKQESRARAIKLGLHYFGPKMVKMIEEVEKMMDDKKLTDDRCRITGEDDGMENQPIANSKTLLVHCWRGGMRSAGIAWLLDLYGFKVYTLSGGYKAFRQWAHRQFVASYNLKIVGGYTGSGKTGIIAEMKRKGIPAVDLEGLANHKGSSFGSIGMPPQPSQEMFENLLALELYNISGQAHNPSLDDSDHHGFLSPTPNNQSSTSLPPTADEQPPTLPPPTLFSPTIWLEDESQRIGNVIIPAMLWEQMRNAHVYFLDIPFEERLGHIIKDYGKADKEKIVNAIIRIKKRLGGLETKTAINHLLEDNLKECFRILLAYYDKYYLKGLQGRQACKNLPTTIECQSINAKENALKLISV